MKSVLVFCGANMGSNPIYKEEAINLAKVFAEKNIQLIYGGGKVGLMGVISREIITLGGKVTGVIPHFLDTLEIRNDDITEVIKVETMHQRKAIMSERCDGVLPCPVDLEVWTNYLKF